MSYHDPVMAICYDFDGTLAPGNMQEHDFFPDLNVAPKDFWEESNALQGNRRQIRYLST